MKYSYICILIKHFFFKVGYISASHYVKTLRFFFCTWPIKHHMMHMGASLFLFLFWLTHFLYLQNYLPHNQDILYARKYWSIGEDYFVVRDSPFLVVLRHLRKPLSQIFWIQRPVLYIIGSSDYDRIYNECNCLVQSLYIFEYIYKNEKFFNDIFILFFNKMDLLAEKVQTADIRKHFPEFQGDPHRLEDVQEFLIQSFKKRTGNYSRPVFYHMITAVDTENFRDVFKTVEDTVMLRNLKGFPIL